MKFLEFFRVKRAIKYSSCPLCREKIWNKESNLFFVNENIMYYRCNFCNYAFKFTKRKLSCNGINISLKCEYVIKKRNGDYYGVRGYSINIETFIYNQKQVTNLKAYFDSGFCEIDDIFKEIPNDSEEIIFKQYGRLFSDEDYYKNKKIIQPWFSDEYFDAHDLAGDFLDELDNM